jgi:hypothetical protein
MNKFLKWIQVMNGEVTLGFDSLVQADAFLHQQSNNPAWLAQWTLRISHPYNEELVTATAKDSVTLHFNRDV